MKSHEYNSKESRVVRCEHCKSLTWLNNATVVVPPEDIVEECHTVGLVPGGRYYCCVYCLEEQPITVVDKNRIPQISMLKALLRHEPEWAIRAIQCLVSDDPRVQRIEMDGNHRLKIEAMAFRIAETGRPHPGEFGFGSFYHLMSIVLPCYAPELHDIAIDNRDRQLKVGKYHPNCVGSTP